MRSFVCYFSLYEVIHFAQLFQSCGVYIYLFIHKGRNQSSLHLPVAQSRWKSFEESSKTEPEISRHKIEQIRASEQPNLSVRHIDFRIRKNGEIIEKGEQE